MYRRDHMASSRGMCSGARGRSAHHSLSYILGFSVLLLRALRGSGQAAQSFVVLDEFSTRVAIQNLTLSAPSHASHVGCVDTTMVFVLSPRLQTGGGTDRGGDHVPSGEVVVLSFGVRDLIMGPGAGRAAVLVDDEPVAECPAQHCRVRLSASRLLTTSVAGRGSSHMPTAHAVRVSLMAPEADMPASAVVLGVQQSLVLALVRAADLDAADTHVAALAGLGTGGRGGLTRVQILSDMDAIPGNYCSPNPSQETQECEADSCRWVDAAPERGAGRASAIAAPKAEDDSAHNGGVGRHAFESMTEGESNEAQHQFMRYLVERHRGVREVLEVGFLAGMYLYLNLSISKSVF